MENFVMLIVAAAVMLPIATFGLWWDTLGPGK